MAIVVLDASVLIAFLDASDRHHRAAVASIDSRRESPLVLPASAYAEVLVGPSRRGTAAMTTVDEFLASAAIRIEPLTREIARHAATLRARHRALRLPDALVISTGETLGAQVLTADRAWLGMSRRARLIAE